MIDINEKIKLAKQAGMSKWADKIQSDISIKHEIERLTAMKFKHTTIERIEEQLSKWYMKFECSEGSMIGTIMFGVAACLMYGMLHNESDFWFRNSYCIPGLISCCFFLSQFISKSQILSMPLKQWTDNIPTGAFLAVTEAKAKGLKDFKIYYPVTQSHYRLMTDPVIVGYLKGKEMENRWGELYHTGEMFEIFAWDDGKIYE